MASLRRPLVLVNARLIDPASGRDETGGLLAIDGRIVEIGPWVNGEGLPDEAEVERLGVEVFHDMAAGLKDVDIVMMLRLQVERMHGSFVPSTREYFHFFGLDYDKLRAAKPDALIMHPGPMNRGVEIGSEIADDIDRSLIRQQVEMGVAVRMACLEILARDLGNGPPLQ